MPGRLAAAIREEQLVIRDLPFASAPFDWALYWHRRHEANPAIRWLRTRIVDTCKSLGGSG
jgi:DNA-binding transcriptional LysR family regulator